MRLGMELAPRMEQRQEARLEQALEVTLNLGMEDPFIFAQDLHERPQKVKVPVSLGRYTILIDAAIVKGKDLETIFLDEKFAGIISREGERYLFFNRELKVPDEARRVMPQLMAFHCLAAIEMPGFGDDSGNLRQFQAIALELAYAKTLLPPRRYDVYESWRPTVERSPFFERGDWKDIVRRTHSGFRDVTEQLHRNAHRAEFAVMVHGESFRLGPKGTAIGRDGEIEVHRKIRKSRSI